jgi:tetratricopeptide (TPR) repeat protein
MKEGRFGEALGLIDQVNRLCELLREDRLLISNLTNQVEIAIDTLGDCALAAQANQRAEDVARKHGFARELAGCEAHWGQIELLQGHTANARQRLETALAALKSEDWAPGVVWIWTLIVETELAAGRPEVALRALCAAEGIPCSMGSDLAPLIDCQRIAVALSLGRVSEALENADRAMKHLNPEMPSVFAIPYRRYQALLISGRREEAVQSLERSIHMLECVLGSLSPEQQAHSRDAVPLHREILAAWADLQPRQVRLRLPRRPGCQGPSLVEEVTLTTWLPQDREIADKVARRRHQLQRILGEAERQGAAPSQTHLARLLDVSLRTVAQDMAALAGKRDQPDAIDPKIA